MTAQAQDLLEHRDMTWRLRCPSPWRPRFSVRGNCTDLYRGYCCGFAVRDCRLFLTRVRIDGVTRIVRPSSPPARDEHLLFGEWVRKGGETERFEPNRPLVFGGTLVVAKPCRSDYLPNAAEDDRGFADEFMGKERRLELRFFNGRLVEEKELGLGERMSR